jgi:hypothetical protein
VSFSCEARTPAYNGSQCSGFKFFSIAPQQPLTVQLGQAPLPAGLETAISHMSKGETALFVLPADQLTASAAGRSAQQASAAQQDSSDEHQQQQCEALIPQPPAKAVQVELSIQLHDLVQVSLMCNCFFAALHSMAMTALLTALPSACLIWRNEDAYEALPADSSVDVEVPVLNTSCC